MSVEINIEFERECGICFGRCAWAMDDKCENCNSTGKVATELGRDLLEFLRNQGIERATSTKET